MFTDISPILPALIGVITIGIVIFIIFIYMSWSRDTALRNSTNPTVPINTQIVAVVPYASPTEDADNTQPVTSIESFITTPYSNTDVDKRNYVETATQSITAVQYRPNAYPLRDYYMMTSFNTCISGPYNSGVVTIQSLRNALNMGFRCLDFEIYSEPDTDNPIVSCSTTSSADGSYPIQSGEPILFSDIMYYISTYAFVSYGAMNCTDPLILVLRIKTSNTNIPSKLSAIFEKYSQFMVDSKYNIINMSNFGLVGIPEIRNHISIFVDSITDSYLTNSSFMKYVNMTTDSEWFSIKRWDEIIPSTDPTVDGEYSNHQITMVIPNSEIPVPINPSIDTYQNEGYQMVGLVAKPQNDPGFINGLDFFIQNHNAFVLKPDNLRYVDNTIIPVDPVPPYDFKPERIDIPTDIPVSFHI